MHDDSNRKLENFWQQKSILGNQKPRTKIKTHVISFVNLLKSKILRTKTIPETKIHACNSRRLSAFLQRQVHLYFSLTAQKTETTGLQRQVHLYFSLTAQKQKQLDYSGKFICISVWLHKNRNNWITAASSSVFQFDCTKTETTGLVRCKSRHVSFLKNIYVMTQHSLAFFKPSSAPCLIKRVN